MTAGDLDRLLDTAAIAELLNGYAYGIDRRDWPRYRAIFADPLVVDLACQMTARHMIAVEGVEQIHMLGGRYEHDVARIDGAWRIATLRLVITMEQGDRELFDIAARRGPQPRADIGAQGLVFTPAAA